MHYKRILLKLSGEVLSGKSDSCFDKGSFEKICEEIAIVHNQGTQIALVVGGGNICRGARSNLGSGRVNADHMGIAATIVNAIALQGYLQKLGIPTKIHSAVSLNGIAEQYQYTKALRHLDKGYLVIFAGGTGHSLCTTDTAAVLRCVEMGCDIMLKGTHVDGVYSTDPTQNTGAVRYDTISHEEVMNKRLKIIDITALSLAMENKVPILVFDVNKQDELQKVLKGEGKFSTIK
jgi:uridylate kinase